MTPDFQAEYHEDRWLWDNFPEFFSKPNFYADVGAAHPIIGSNTQWLRSLGWGGLHIDADNDWAPHWNGNFIHAVVSRIPSVHFEINPVHCLSRIGDGLPDTPTVPLSAILEQAQVDRIGFLSIDVEGHEYEVIRSFDIDRYRPSFIAAEFNTMGIGEDYSVMDYLLSKGYKVIHQTIANMIYTI